MLVRRWSNNERVLFFSGFLLLYIFPLILADYRFIDDGFRSVAGDANWNSEGRFLMTGFYRALSLTNRSPDSFPLALMLTTILMAFALASLARHYFKDVDLFRAIVVLPLFCSPFFLSNLSYQYDGPVMVVGVAALTFAMTFESARRWLSGGLPALLILVALAIYQPLLNLWLGLCCVELYRGLVGGETLTELARFILRKAVHLLLATLVYLAVVAPFMAGDRLDLVAFDATLPSVLAGRLIHIAALLQPFCRGWFFMFTAMLSGLGYLVGGWQLLNNREGYLHKGLAAALYLLIPIALVISIPGVMLIFKDEQNDSRLMVGVAPLLVWGGLMMYRLLSRLHAQAGWLMVLLALFMLDFSYSYGRLLEAKKQLETTLVNSLAYTISASPQLIKVKRFYFAADTNTFWLPAAKGTVAAIPIMPYVLSANFLLMPYGLSRAGITNVDWEDIDHPASAVLDSRLPPVVDNRFYAIYLFNDEGYIIMKVMAP